MRKQPQTLLAEIGAYAESKNIRAWAVGGFARDWYLGRKTRDIDICTESDPSELIKFLIQKYGARAQCFKDFGTARVTLQSGLKLDFVRCRKEFYANPAALPRVTPSDLKDDLFRRDFTCNAWAMSILPGEFFKSYDLYDSKTAIDGKYIKILHSKSFIDDPSRIFRALRFAARFNWTLHEETRALLIKAVEGKYINLLSRERVCAELIKILCEKNPLKIFYLLGRYRVTPYIWPELKTPKNLLKLKTPEDRLALLALKQGVKGIDFLKSLRLSRQTFNYIAYLVNLYHSGQAPLIALTKTQKKILKLHNPKIPAAALKQCFITGAMLRDLGYTGHDIGKTLTETAKLQGQGKLKNRLRAYIYVKRKSRHREPA